MSRDNLVFLLSGVFFGVLVGWIFGSQRLTPPVAAAAPVAATAPASAGNTAQPPAPPPLDENRAAELQKVASAEPKNSAVRAELGNLYFDSERFDQAIPWYEAALKLTPTADISTDLGVSYLYSQQTDKAIAQFEQSIKIDPKHLKTWLNIGIAKAMVKGDTAGGEAAWKKVIEIAPGSEEAKRAQQGIDALKGGHKGAIGG